MPIAMLIGALFYGWLSQLEFITPYLIFAMLLLTFCKIKPSEMKVSFMHLWLLLIQILGSVAAYYLFYPLGKVVAESVMVCVIAPTATASAVITAKLGGSAASLAAYTLLSNLGTAMAVPIIFPLVEENAELGFLVLSMRIFSKVFPLLICPFLLSVLLRGIVPGVYRKLKECSGAAFYIWAASLAIVMAEITQAILSGTTSVGTEIVIALCSLAVCCLLFFHRKENRTHIWRFHQWRTGTGTEKYDIGHLDCRYLPQSFIGNRSRRLCGLAKHNQQLAIVEEKEERRKSIYK